MNNLANIEHLKVWRQIADTLRRSHESHEWRGQKIQILLGLMAHSARWADADMKQVTAALDEVLRYLRNGDYLTHVNVKNGLSLFMLMCDIQIELWSPKHVSIVQPQVDEVSDLPF